MPITAFVHTHVLMWVLLLVTFFVAFSMYKKGKNGKGAHMAYRLFMLLTLGTGLYLYLTVGDGVKSSVSPFYDIKMTAGLLVLILGEMTLIRLKKGKSYTGLFGGFAVFALAAVFLGYALPLGLSFFNSIIFG
ncbi:DUF1516 family protein [Exiguobacterium flavidum]|uniref:DUF1516 family protein n=1 Tax=Exiguobacterium flavidum TaxID=2184695 RepID=UPI000DF77478|nr:DUF1516 family protein [Exiguobacterium flavidum]